MEQNDNRLERLNTIISEQGIEIKGHCNYPAENSTISSIPTDLHPSVYRLAKRLYPDGIYSHQAEAISRFLSSENICLATPTASGKSLVFMLAAAHVVKKHSNAKVLALYPAKALIQDQIQKWNATLSPIAISIAFIDGSVPQNQREKLINQSSIILMTPDVAHAWLISKLDQPKNRNFMSALQLLILDEAHVYDGVFGTNMAYFLRRLQVVSNIKNIIVSTATIGNPLVFMEKITGCIFSLIDETQNGTGSKGRDLFCLTSDSDNKFDVYVKFIKALTKENIGRFIAFADSRKMVEMLVVSLHREDTTATQQENQELDASINASMDMDEEELMQILPYRAGYEEQDRKDIQQAIEKGELSGVVATSALELGIDIRDLDIVILLGMPPSVKAFKQRIGRVGRHKHGFCLLIDDKGIISSSQEVFENYTNRPSEPNWLYLENRYIQYTNVLCASLEVESIGVNDARRHEFFSTLPDEFERLLLNELNQTEDIPTDLYSYKQRGQNAPHIAFPLRAGLEPSLKVQCTQGAFIKDYGTVTFSQSLKESYPGAVYYYMAKPYRVYNYSLTRAEISIKKERHYTTEPNSQVMVFPKFQHGIIQLRKSSNGFIAESELQISEKVSGFTEKRGGNTLSVVYDQNCIYAQRPVVRYFETTGVCWYFSDKKVIDKTVASLICNAFCLNFGIQNRDIGCEIFHTKNSPNDLGASCTGFCIFDRTSGSLRITQLLFVNFEKIIETAITIYSSGHMDNLDFSHEVSEALQSVLVYAKNLGDVCLHTSNDDKASVDLSDEWVIVLAAGSCAYLLKDTGDAEEITIKSYRYTPSGLMYDVFINTDGTRLVANKFINAIPEKSKFINVNLYSGEEKSI